MRTQEQTETLAKRYPQSAYTINGKLHVAISDVYAEKNDKEVLADYMAEHEDECNECWTRRVIEANALPPGFGGGVQDGQVWLAYGEARWTGDNIAADACCGFSDCFFIEEEEKFLNWYNAASNCARTGAECAECVGPVNCSDENNLFETPELTEARMSRARKVWADMQQ